MIRISQADEDDLRWWANDWDEGDMGRRSVQGPIEEMLLAGGPRASTGPRDAPSSRAMSAATRARRIRRRIQPLIADHRLILRHAFYVHDVRAGLSSYGTYPGAVFGSRGVFARYKEAGGTRLDELGGWLRELVRRATAPGPTARGQGKLAAQALVRALTDLAEAELVEALTAYGARMDTEATGAQARRSATTQELATALGVDPKTVLRQIRQRAVRQSHSHGRRLIILADLALKWPEAAQALGRELFPT